MRELKRNSTFATRKIRESSFEILVKTEGKFFQKKVSKSFAGLKRSSTFAPASREDSNKQRRHVHRHIELTALNRSNPVQK